MIWTLDTDIECVCLLETVPLCGCALQSTLSVNTESHCTSGLAVIAADPLSIRYLIG